LRPTLIFLMVPFSFLVYFLLVLGMGIFQEYPVIHYLVAFVALFYLFKATREKRTAYLWVLNGLGWVLTLFFIWWTLIFSTYKQNPWPIKEQDNISARIADMALETVDGEPVVLPELLQKNPTTLLVFFRGHW